MFIYKFLPVSKWHNKIHEKLIKTFDKYSLTVVFISGRNSLATGSSFTLLVAFFSGGAGDRDGYVGTHYSRPIA